MPNAKAEKLKGEGNTFFKNGKYQEAIAKYKDATAIDASVPSYWSNMAACHEKVREYDEMAEASRQCILADTKFVKGYYRLAIAQKALDDLPNCIKTLESGLGVQSSNPDLKRMKKEVLELQRGEQVATYCRKAEEQMQNGDVGGAVKTLELASRLDAGNPDIEKMKKKVTPKFEAQEKKRKAKLGVVEKHKEKGDECYKNASFEDAIIHYGKCIDMLVSKGKGGSELALKAYANRAGTYIVREMFTGQAIPLMFSHTPFSLQLATSRLATLMEPFRTVRVSWKWSLRMSRPWSVVPKPLRV
jgi:tetratricopeptide (TPR) repeat protein